MRPADPNFRPNIRAHIERRRLFAFSGLVPRFVSALKTTPLRV
jgi:hypothetical protein